MQLKEKISERQASLLIFTYITSTLILSVPGIMVSFAKQNAWMSIIPASLTGIKYLGHDHTLQAISRSIYHRVQLPDLRKMGRQADRILFDLLFIFLYLQHRKRACRVSAYDSLSEYPSASIDGDLAPIVRAGRACRCRGYRQMQ